MRGIVVLKGRDANLETGTAVFHATVKTFQPYNQGRAIVICHQLVVFPPLKPMSLGRL